MLPLRTSLFVILVAASLFGIALAIGVKDVILEPIAGSTGEEVCIIFMQGADISPLQYAPLLKIVQEELQSYKVWVSDFRRLKKYIYNTRQKQNAS